jgi:hypothetical protein
MLSRAGSGARPSGSDQGSQRYRAPSPTMAIPGRAGNGPGIMLSRTRVNSKRGTREPNRSSDDDFPRAVVTSPPTGGSGSLVRRLPRPLR